MLNQRQLLDTFTRFPALEVEKGEEDVNMNHLDISEKLQPPLRFIESHYFSLDVELY